MAEHWKADDVLHGKSGELVIAGGDADGPAESFGSKVSACSSTSSLMGEDYNDEAESSLVVVADPTTKSSSSTMQLAEHQLDVLSPLLANLSVRTGLSKYYQEKSPKKTTTCSTRMKGCRAHSAAGPSANRPPISLHLPGPYSKIITKKTTPRNRKSPPYKGKKEYLS